MKTYRVSIKFRTNENHQSAFMFITDILGMFAPDTLRNIISVEVSEDA